MSFTPPDLSEVLSNEYLMNSRLTTLRANLRNGLTNAGITYDESDTIIQLIDKYRSFLIFETVEGEDPSAELGTIFQLANISNTRWMVSKAANNAYFLGYEKDTSAHEFEESGGYYSAAFGKFNTKSGTYYYGDNKGWKMEFKLWDVGTQYGFCGLGFLVSTEALTDRNSNGYIGTFIGLCGGYPGVWNLNGNWGLPDEVTSFKDIGRNFKGSVILEKGDDHQLEWAFKDSNGDVIQSGILDPTNILNSDEITFGMFSSSTIEQGGYCSGMINQTLIYYEGE